MILILSDNSDTSTTKVIEWLDFYSKKWLRVNVEDKIELEFIGDDIIFKNVDFTFKLSNITEFWYRRGAFNFRNKFNSEIKLFGDLQIEERNKIIQYIYYKLNKIKHLNSIVNADVNKLIVSDIARNFKILTPKDFLFSNFRKLKDSLLEKKYITKVISGNCMYDFNGFTIFNYTNIINLKELNNKSFFPSLIQNYIEKKYELRIFYLDGVFYSMAIFSQTDAQTTFDFRNYNNIKPNRTVPFKLPNNIEKKLDLLMKRLDLNCGSIDMIVTPENQYIFLEVNPVGQFGMISYPCNYYLEKKIAKYFYYE